VADAAETAITPDEGAYAFQALLRHDRAYTGYAPLSGTPWFTALAQRSRFAERFQSTGQGSAETSKVLDELSELPKDEWPTRLRRLISEQVSVILRRTIDPDRPLSEYGLDSLGNLELRTHIKAETGVRITSADITTIQGLAGLLCEKLESPQGASSS
jgi:polyketide synthase 5